MKKNLIYLLAMLLVGCAGNNASSSTLNSESISLSDSSSTSIIESTSSSKVIDYGRVQFDTIELYPDGYDGVKIRPYFSNSEIEGKVEFTYVVEDENICEIDQDNKLWYKQEGYTYVTAKSEYYDDQRFMINCKKTMTPEWMFSIAKSMTRSVLNDYQEGDSLFIGDSFFQFWREGTTGVRRFADVFSDYKAFNIGINSATTHDWRAMHESTTNLTSPKNIVINIGVNNVDDDAENGLKCFRNIKALVDDYLEIFEETNVYYLSITRCTGTFAAKWDDHSLSNSLMKKYCESKDRLHYLDVMELYGNNPGEYQSDGLHPNQAGYDLFEQIIKENVPLEEK